MNGFYTRRYNADDPQQYGAQEEEAQMMDLSGGGMVGPTNMPGAQSLDDIVNQHAKDLRRRSMPVPFQGGDMNMDGSMRRSSMADMMEFGNASPEMDNFQFDPTMGMDFNTPMTDIPARQNDGSRNQHTSNMNNLSVNTQFQSSVSPYGNMQSRGGFDPGMASGSGLDMGMDSPYLTSAFPTSMGMGTDMGMMSSEMNTPDMFAAQFGSPMANSPMQTSYPNASIVRHLQDPGGGTPRRPTLQRQDQKRTANLQRENTTTTTSGNDSISQQASRQGSSSTPATTSASNHQNENKTPRTKHDPQNSSGPPEMINGKPLPWVAPPEGWPSSMYGRTHMQTQYKDAYAPSGYDLMMILYRVASRPNPQINIGAVDLSCAFVVCNTKVHDAPIEYCSESFERLTGYQRHSILGQNCRFLQSPDGEVTPGIRRKYCDDDSVRYLKNTIASQQEAQISLINYRKGGQPFMNLLTMIPVRDDTGEVTHIVGFQVDLVENPTAVSSKNPDGSYSVNYQRHESLPSYYLSAPSQNLAAETGQTVSRDEVSTVLNTIGSGENDLGRRLMDKVLLENADDVIHVLSLKGLFLYLSPSCRKILEYDASELVGTPISSVCHPSDIVPVTRELKDPSSGSSLSVVFRIRRKNSGYTWFESHGSLHTEQGKGRKCIILVGRERPVYALSKAALQEGGGIGENEIWTKMSTTGMFLYVSSNVRQLLDLQPDELLGTNIQQLMRPDSKEEFGRVLTMALTGKNTSVRHEMTNKRGQVLQAFSWIYPGDATEGMKPTFLVVQIRLLRYHRGGGQKQSLKGSDSLRPATLTAAGSGTPFSQTSGTIDTSIYRSAEGYAMTHAGQSGLAIGNQDVSLASEDNVFDELKTTKGTSWQFELRQMEKRNRLLAEEVQSLIAAKKKRKRRRGAGLGQKDCANCHTKNTPEWRRGPSGQRDLCNSCGLRWAKQNGRVSPRTNSQHSVKSAHSDKASKASASPLSDRPQIGDQPSIASLTSPMANANMSQEEQAMRRDRAQQEGRDNHAAKLARMEKGTGELPGSGVPPKIDEEGEAG